MQQDGRGCISLIVMGYVGVATAPPFHLLKCLIAPNLAHKAPPPPRNLGCVLSAITYATPDDFESNATNQKKLNSCDHYLCCSVILV